MPCSSKVLACACSWLLLPLPSALIVGRAAAIRWLQSIAMSHAWCASVRLYMPPARIRDHCQVGHHTHDTSSTTCRHRKIRDTLSEGRRKRLIPRTLGTLPKSTPLYLSLPPSALIVGWAVNLLKA